MLFFKVFDAEDRRLECCSGEEREANARSARDHSSSSSPWESSSSPELYQTQETSDHSYVPPSSRHAQSSAAVSGRRRR